MPFEPAIYDGHMRDCLLALHAAHERDAVTFSYKCKNFEVTATFKETK